MSYCLANRVISNGWFTVKMGFLESMILNIEEHSVRVELVPKTLFSIFENLALAAGSRELVLVENVTFMFVTRKSHF